MARLGRGAPFKPLILKAAVPQSVGDVTLALTGQGLTVSQGSLAPQVQAALSGQSLSLAQGSLVAGVSSAITGQSLTLANGSLTAAVEAPLVGQAVSLAQGDVGVGGDIVRALTGQSLTVSLANLSIAVEDQAQSSNWQNTPKNFLWSRKELEPEEAEIIESLAETQAEDLKSNEAERKEQLRKALKLRNIAVELRHIEAMNALREQRINAEIAAFMKITQIEAENEQYLELVLLAAAA